MYRTAPALATAALIVALLPRSPACAQDAPPGGAIAQSAWQDPDASARRLALARVEQRISILTREERAEEALTWLEGVAADRLARDRDSLGRLIDATRRLDPPHGEPGWIWAGIPIAALGVAGAVVAPLAIALGSSCVTGCIERDEGPWVSALVLAGTVFVTGAVLIIVGLVRHVFAPERRRFLERRRDLVHAFAEARAGAALTW